MNPLLPFQFGFLCYIILLRSRDRGHYPDDEAK